MKNDDDEKAYEFLNLILNLQCYSQRGKRRESERSTASPSLYKQNNKRETEEQQEKMQKAKENLRKIASFVADIQCDHDDDDHYDDDDDISLFLDVIFGEGEDWV